MAALATPWRTDGGLDMAGLERLLARIVGGGADGVSPAGSTGEGAKLSPAQRVDLTRAVRRMVPAGMPVISGVPLTTVAAGRAELGELAAAGATAALVAPPSYYPLSDDAVRELYASVAEASPLPIVLYNIPMFTKVRLAPAAVGWLAGHPSVIGIKDSSRDMEYQQEVIIATAGADFHVLTGTDTLLIPSLAMGAAGTIAGSVNLVPDLVSGIYRAFTAGDIETAVLSQRRLAGVVGICRPGFFPAGWKAALEVAGVCGRSPVPPGTPVTDAEFKRLAEELAAMGVTG